MIMTVCYEHDIILSAEEGEEGGKGVSVIQRE